VTTASQFPLNAAVKDKSSGFRQDVQPRPAWISDELFPYTSRWIEVDGALMHYVDEGSGPVLLMVAGTPMWSFMYRHPIQKLRNQFRCIAVDLPGFGLSQAPLFPGKAFKRSADWLQGFVRTLGLTDFTLVVHATAGPSALEMAVREHERVRALVISNSFAWPPADQAPARQMVKIISSSLFRTLNFYFNLLPRLATRVARRNGRLSPQEKAAILGPFENQQARGHLQNFLLGIRVEREMFLTLQIRMAALRQKPALLLYGTHEPGFKAGFFDKWKQLLPNHKAILLSDSGHYALEDQPDRYTSELKLWLEERIQK
jgi:haloalkane dehalogenase